jgi:hypothetical protein
LDWWIHIIPDPIHVHLGLSLLLRCQIVESDDVLDPMNEFDEFIGNHRLLFVDKCIDFSDKSLNILDYLAQITNSLV